MKLTQKEKQVLYGLTGWPELNDKELANKLNLKRSTVTSIRNKLKKRKYFQRFILPNFEALLPAKNIAFQKINFAPLVKKVLDIRTI